MNPASEYVRANKSDSALMLFREASIISRDMPDGFYNMAVLFANGGTDDSAVIYFRKAAEQAALDERFAERRNSATFNLAAMYQRMGRHAEAAVELQKYVVWMPNDIEAKRALAQSLRLSGKMAESQAIEQQLLANAASTGTLTTNDMMAIGVNLFNDKKYAEAAVAFQKVVDQSPNDRFAWFNLANTHLALKDGPKLVLAAGKLAMIEPLNEDNLKLLGEGYRITNKQDSLIATVTKLLALPTSVGVSGFTSRADGAKITGEATGRPAQNAKGVNLPAAAVTVTFEFLNAEGVVVATQDLAVPALKATEKHPFTVDATGTGIASWRYRAK